MVFPAERRGAAFGVWGAVAGLATAAGPTLGGLLAICYGLVEGQRYNWGTISSFISIPLFIGVGVALLVAFFVVQRRRQDREPLVPFVLFRSRNFTLVNWVSCTLSVGML